MYLVLDPDNEDIVVKVSKGKVTLYLDGILKTKDIFASGIKFIPMIGDVASTAVESNKVKNNVDITNLHEVLGKCGEATARMTGKSDEHPSAGETCEAGSVGKAKQKNAKEDWEGNSVAARENLYFDISFIKVNMKD
jgi:hypothetical protein